MESNKQTTMKGNQGLDALAALCGGQTDAPTVESKGVNEIGAQRGESASQISSQQAQSSQDSALQARQLAGQVPGQQSPLQNMTQQQWQQAIAAATALQGGGVNQSLAAQSLLLSAGYTPQQHISDNSFSTMKQLAYHQYVQAQANITAQQASQSLASGGKGAFGDQSQHALIMALAGGKSNPFSNAHVAAELLKPSSQPQQQVIPAAASSNSHLSHAEAAPTPAAAGNKANVSSSPVLTSMKPPPPPSQGVQSTLSTAGIQSMMGQPKIAPMPGGKVLPNNEGAAAASIAYAMDDKKQIKRAANRRSAQLSRKRKKQFIEELKEENDELRRKEQILRSIPDLIVVFDSSGKLGFVSQSVSRFIEMTPEELEGTSFWDRLCEDSVRLLKAAFMDALAARKPDSNTASLGSGVWELRLVDKYSNHSVVTLNGVVHFSGEAPECVCCIRPRDQQPIRQLAKEIKDPSARPVSSSDGSRSSEGSTRDYSLEIRAKPNQRVTSSNDASADDSGTKSESSKKPRREERSADGEGAVRISDGDSVEVSSGSDD